MPVELSIVESATTLDSTVVEVILESASAPGPAGPGVAPGGTIGQVLTKQSSTDFDTDWETGGGGGGVTDADYLVGTSNAGLSAEIVVGTSPGGELGGSWASPTVDATHSGSSHATVQSAAEATAAAALSAHVAASDPHPTYTTAAELAAFAQPLDSDLTAIAALSTTSFGRGLLALADAAALLSAAGAAAASHAHAGEDITSGTVADARIASTIARDSEVTSAIAALSTVYQPLDSDLTSIAALTTTTFGRAFLALADEAAFKAAVNLEIGTDVQAQDAELAAIAGLTSAADRLPYFTGSGTASLATFTSAGRALVDDADAAAQLVTLGVAAAITATKIDDLTAGDDNTDLNVSTTKHGLTPKLPNDATKYLDGSGAYSVPAGSAPTSLSAALWGAISPADMPPTSPGNLDDEFDDSNFTGWTGRNTPGTVTESAGYAVMACAAQTGTTVRMYEKTVSGAFDITAKMFHGTPIEDYYEAGLYVANDGSGKLLGFEQVISNTTPNYMQLIRLNSPTSFNAVIFSRDLQHIVPYMRIVSDGTTVSFYWSLDGIAWSLLGTEALATFITSVDRAGFGMNPNHNLASTMSLHWFRGSA